MSRRIDVFVPMVTQEMKDAASRVIDSGRYIRTSPETASEGRSLEQEFGAYLGWPDGRRPHVANLANGTAAMHLAWIAYNLAPGDEVIIPANTFVSVAHCVSLVGATPVFVDVEPDIYNMDPQAVAAAITPRTRAIMPVHTAGHAADLDPILELAEKHDLIVVEDACQSIGAKYKGKAVGTLGHMGCYSFVQNKAMTCGGEGGAVGSFDETRVRRVFNLANHARGEQFHRGMGAGEPYRVVVHDEIGFNYRQSEILSAIARVQLGLLPSWLALRRKWVDLYRAMITDAQLPVQAPAERSWAEHSYVRFEVRVPRRDALRAFLKTAGIGTSVHYPTPLHLDHPYKDIVKMPEGSLPNCERLANEILTLPLYPQMAEDDVAYVVDHLKTFFSRRAATG